MYSLDSTKFIVSTKKKKKIENFLNLTFGQVVKNIKAKTVIS